MKTAFLWARWLILFAALGVIWYFNVIGDQLIISNQYGLASICKGVAF